MKYWTFKKANFKSSCGIQVYEGYLFEEFQGYYYKKKLYKLVEKRTLKGIERKEKFIGYGYDIFFRKVDGNFISWNEWKSLQLNFDNEYKKELVTI